MVSVLRFYAVTSGFFLVVHCIISSVAMLEQLVVAIHFNREAILKKNGADTFMLHP